MNNQFFVGIGGAGRSRLPTKFLKYKKDETAKQIMFITDDTEEDDDQIRKSDDETL